MARAQDATVPPWGLRMSPLQKNQPWPSLGTMPRASYQPVPDGYRWGGRPPTKTSQERRET